jgi:glycosyltransferase involved in cell wall biosynthesis/SAM-dependent methyltransferase
MNYPSVLRRSQDTKTGQDLLNNGNIAAAKKRCESIMADGKILEAKLARTPSSGVSATVAVVIPTFNHAHFLSDAIESVLAQTRPVDEIIVVDDGSNDDPAAIVARFKNVQLIRQSNRGLSAARNAGLRSCNTSYVIFLDADDRLLPNAIEASLAAIEAHPECAFVYGGYRLVSKDGRPITSGRSDPIDDARLAFLRGDPIAIHTVLFRRDRLLTLNGFDENLRRCEDYDLHLRVIQKYPIARHSTLVAEYRRHDENMSSLHSEQLKTVLRLLDRYQSSFDGDELASKALREGRARKQKFYVAEMLQSALARWHAGYGTGALALDLSKIARLSPYFFMRSLVSLVGRPVARKLPRAVVRRIDRILGRHSSIPIGKVAFGDLRRLTPISVGFGWDRGTPIDRYYIEGFLARNAGDIRGRVLEAGDSVYTRRFGGAGVDRTDVVCVEANNPIATIVGDLENPQSLPESTFDCIILTQTLQFVFDVRAAIATIYRALKPGGVLLVTVPGISKMHDSWPFYWTFSLAAARQLLAACFGDEGISVEEHGNVFAASAFVHGVALEEVERAELDVTDPHFPVIVAARAVKRKET